MAKSATMLVKMTSTGTMPDGSLTGTYFVIKKNPKNAKGEKAKRQMKKYDKRIRKHVLFVEKKMPSHSA
jgi:ribosomal protein L33